jgi:regulatory protein
MKKIITQLVASKRKPERVNIYADSEFLLQVHCDLVAQYQLAKGSVITNELLAQLSDNKRLMYLKQRAISFVSFKPRTEFQVRERFKKMECTADEIELCVEFLYEFGYLNDEQYANMYVSDMLLRKAVSPTKLANELRKRGIREEYFNRAIMNGFPHDEIEQIAKKAAEKKLRSVTYKPLDKQKNSVRDYLLRQGFSFDIIKKILNQIFS